MPTVDRRTHHEHHVTQFERYTEAIQRADAQTLKELCAPEFCVFEPDVFDEPVRGLDAWCAVIEAGPQAAAHYEVVRTQSVAESLIVELRYTPPEGGDPESWMLVYCFSDGKIVRQDAQRME